MLSQYCAIFLYVLAIIAQCAAALYALNLFYQSKSYRLASGTLAFGFSLMIGRRISPLLHFYTDGYANIFDAFLAFIISALLFFGLYQVKRIILDLEEKNFFLDRASKTDSLTQASSRSETFARAELEIERALRNEKPIAFLMIDIDHFKLVNDEYGHPAGDIVLQGLTKICQAELRAIDVFGRVGGEEFFIVLPETSEALAFEVAERVRCKVASKASAMINGQEIYITVSIGLAGFDPNCHGETDSGVILRTRYKCADEAMYFAKISGRNQTQIWTHKINHAHH